MWTEWTMWAVKRRECLNFSRKCSHEFTVVLILIVSRYIQRNIQYNLHRNKDVKTHKKSEHHSFSHRNIDNNKALLFQSNRNKVDLMKHKHLAVLLFVLFSGNLFHPAALWAADVITFYFSDAALTSQEALGALPSGSNSVVQQYRINNASIDNVSFTDIYTNSTAYASIRNDGMKYNGYADAPPLLLDYASSSKTSVDNSKITFTGLAQNATYTIYVYSQGFNDATHNFVTNIDVNTNGAFSRLGTLTTADNANYVNGQNYLASTVETTSTGKLVVSFYTNAGSTINRGALNAVQLVYGDPAPVPEPASVALLGIGGCALLAIRSGKRRCTTGEL